MVRKLAGAMEYRFHDLRHTKLSPLYKGKKFSSTLLGQFSGHRPEVGQSIYTHQRLDELRAIADYDDLGLDGIT